MKNFVWGQVISLIDLDLDGDSVQIIKYFPKIYADCRPTGEYESEPMFHIEETHRSFTNIQAAIIHYLTFKNLGLNNDSLAQGVCRAIGVKE